MIARIRNVVRVFRGALKVRRITGPAHPCFPRWRQFPGVLRAAWWDVGEGAP